MSKNKFAALWGEIEDLPLIFKVDLLHWDELANEQLKQKIRTEGRVFYP